MKIAQRDFTKLLGLLAITFILPLLVSCSSWPEDAIVGKWSEIGGTEKMEFFKDGTFTVTDKGMNMGGLGALAGRSWQQSLFQVTN